jgi:hypothetical protein
MISKVSFNQITSNKKGMSNNLINLGLRVKKSDQNPSLNTAKALQAKWGNFVDRVISELFELQISITRKKLVKSINDASAQTDSNYVLYKREGEDNEYSEDIIKKRFGSFAKGYCNSKRKSDLSSKESGQKRPPIIYDLPLNWWRANQKLIGKTLVEDNVWPKLTELEHEQIKKLPRKDLRYDLNNSFEGALPKYKGNLYRFELDIRAGGMSLAKHGIGISFGWCINRAFSFLADGNTMLKISNYINSRVAKQYIKRDFDKVKHLFVDPESDNLVFAPYIGKTEIEAGGVDTKYLLEKRANKTSRIEGIKFVTGQEIKTAQEVVDILDLYSTFMD